VRTLDRATLESLVLELIERTKGPCIEALRMANLAPNQIDEVILVGGQTRTPKVIEAVREVFGREPNRQINPDEVVGIGAAIQAGILKGEVKDLILLDVTPLSSAWRRAAGCSSRSSNAIDGADPEEPDLHDRGRQPVQGGGPRAAGRARDLRLQQIARAVRPRGDPPGPQGRTPSRRDLRR